jgi:hypothetical protein
MEIFVDFGLFELLAAIGLAALARRAYSHRWLAFPFLAVSALAPGVLVAFAPDALSRWVAVVALGTALVNAAVIVCVIRRLDVREIVPQWRLPRRAGAVSHRPPVETAK